MSELQELISRGRFIFSGAPKRLEVFKLVNGKKSTKDIAVKTGRSLPSVLQDIKKLRDMELVKEKEDRDGTFIKKGGASVYEKAPLVRHIPLPYFQDVSQTKKLAKEVPKKKSKSTKVQAVHVPSERTILDICNHGEDQLYEFKSPGAQSSKITKEIAAFSHTRSGGIIFYGIDDDGTIIGSDMIRQKFDQSIQNSIRNTLSPSLSVTIKDRNVMGSKILLVIIPPWDRRTLYQYTLDNRYYIRKGTNVFALKPDEIKKLLKGKDIV